MSEQSFLGTGWGFPVAPAADGDLALVSEAEDIRQAILILLQTEPGERVMRPDYGAGLRSHVFDVLSTSTMALVRHRVEQSLTKWEPRIDVKDVLVCADGAALGRLDIEIRYLVRTTNTFYNLVYPFYLQEARV